MKKNLLWAVPLTLFFAGCEQTQLAPKQSGLSANSKTQDETDQIPAIFIANSQATLYVGDTLKFSIERCLCGGGGPTPVNTQANVYLVDVTNPCKTFLIASNITVVNGFYPHGKYVIPGSLPTSKYKVAADDLTYGGTRTSSFTTRNIITQIAYSSNPCGGTE